MINNGTIIGGADAPTYLFLLFSWLNLIGLIIVVLMLIPNMVYAFRKKGQENRCRNKLMNILEQVGRYGCMFLMIFNIGITERGFASKGLFIAYLFGNTVLLLSYWIIWALFFRKADYPKQIALAVIPAMIFILNGVTMMYLLLVVFGVIFGVAHIYVTRENRV